MQNHNDTIIKTQEDFACVRELVTEHNCNILTPTLMAVSVVPFSFSRAAQPEDQGPALCWMMAFFTASYRQLLWTPIQSGAPRAPSAYRGFPYHILSATFSNCSLFLS